MIFANVEVARAIRRAFPGQVGLVVSSSFVTVC